MATDGLAVSWESQTRTTGRAGALLEHQCLGSPDTLAPAGSESAGLGWARESLSHGLPGNASAVGPWSGRGR